MTTRTRSTIFPVSRSQRPDAPNRYMIFGPLGRHLGNVDRQLGVPIRWRVSGPDDVRIGEDVRTLEQGIDSIVLHLQEAGER